MCSSPKFEYKDYKPANEGSVKKFLKTLEAEDSTYSVLFFTNGFLQQEKLEVKNNDEVIFADILETDRSFGLAKTLRVKNQQGILIKDVKTGYSFKLPSKKNVKYKYIYISKDPDKKAGYSVNYSNVLQSFY